MSAVILVRHALPEIERGLASKLWGLSESSREDCVLLAHALPAPVAGAVVTSDERKARETAEVIALRLGLQVETDPRLAEVDRPQVWDRDYREVAAAYLAGTPEPGWEAREAVVGRFAAAVTDARVRAEGADVIVVSHGMAISLWVASVCTIDLPAWWRELTLPDAWRVDPAAGTVEHLWMGGTSGD